MGEEGRQKLREEDKRREEVRKARMETTHQLTY